MSVKAAVSHRRRRRGRALARLAMWTLAFTLFAKQVAFEDLGALLVHQPGVTARVHQFMLDSPFGTIHAATFSMPQPIGTGIPHPPIYALANFDPLEIARSIGAELLGDPNAPLQYPTVNRRDKTDSLLHRERLPLPPLPPELPIKPMPSAEVDAPLKAETGIGRFDPYLLYEFSAVMPETDSDMAATPRVARAPGKAALTTTIVKKDAARIYFQSAPLVAAHATLKPYAPGQAPLVKALAASGDPDIQLAALASGGESIANKGEVTGPNQLPKSPAQRLGLTGAARAKAERCLANAVYFEARGEPVRGQIAVAQVVMNRVFSPFYPDNVCGVVYQNANRRNACQFTFACDGIPELITEPDAWARAKRIAKDMLDGKLWLPQVAKSTHYHAYWVHPDWVAEMRKIYHIGVHTFYRPRAWGTGSDEPSFSNPATTARETRLIKRM